MAVTVENGVNTLCSDLAGKTVGDIRRMLSQALNIDPASRAYVDRVPADSATVVADDSVVEFIKASGSKGNN